MSITCRFALALVLLTLLFHPEVQAQTVTDANLSVTTWTSGMTLPTTMAFIGPDDALVLQKNNGRVRRVIAGILQAGQVLDVHVSSTSEQGLLGIALHPDFSNNNYVYLFYTESSTAADGGSPAGNRVYRYTWNGSALISPLLIFDAPGGPGPNHDGGIITFGPDGKLYAVVGDLNRNNQPENYSSGNPPDDSGVIVRLNDDGSIPADNPFFSVAGANDAMKRTYAYGIRNSFGLDFDPVSNALWDTENGPGEMDEINRCDAGFNSGWERYMGPQSMSASYGAPGLFSYSAAAQYSDPEFSWVDTVAPTAIHFYRATQLGAAYLHDCFVGDNNLGFLYRFEMNPGRTGFVLSGNLADLVANNNNDAELGSIKFGTGFGAITDIKTGPDGALYVVSISNGAVYRIHSPVASVANWQAY